MAGGAVPQKHSPCNAGESLVKLSHLGSVVTITCAGACASLAPSRSAVSQPYQVVVRNETGAAITVEYCGPADDCARLGELGAAASGSFAVPASAAQSGIQNRILLLGKSYFPGGYRQLAIQPVHLSRPAVEVTLRQRGAAPESAPGSSQRSR
jgi:hypothetical protein